MVVANVQPLVSENDHRLALRYAGMLHGNIKGNVCASNGIHTPKNVIEVILAGADVVQVVSTLFRNKIEYIESLVGGGWSLAGSLDSFERTWF